MNRDELNAIKEMASLHIEEIFDALDINYRDRYNYIVAPCPVHGGSRRDAFSWHLHRDMWKCFSRECDATYGSDIFGLVMGINKCSFDEAVVFIRKFIDLSMSVEDVQKLKDRRDNREFIESQKRRQQVVEVFDNTCLDRLQYHTYLETRGYPRELIEKYQIGACFKPGAYMNNRIVVPVINPTGEIVGFTGRTLNPDWKENEIPKWKHSRGGWVSRNLFNANNASPFIQDTGVAILCEGPLDVLRLEEAGVHNSVAILGKKLYSGQISMLIAMGATKLLVALDNDAAGKVGTTSAIKSVRCLFDIETIKIPDTKKDIGEMSINEIKGVFNDYEVLWN